MEDGRPIGLMLVGKHWDERTIYRASEAFERSGDWMTF
jgi:amidase